MNGDKAQEVCSAAFLSHMVDYVCVGVGLPPEYFYHENGDTPQDVFDKMTCNGWKLNLVTGKYYKPNP